MAEVLLSIWYDTEDYVCPASDDAALRIAQAHAAAGVRATFKVVGEKARVLAERGRTDVIAALAAHDVGYHSDRHSAHPVVTEYCEPLPWPQGVDLWRRLETDGYRDVAAIFDCQPTTYGQAGASWAAQTYPVLREWGVRSYIDDGPWVGLDGKPFYFMGLLHTLGIGHSLRHDPRDPDSVDGALARLREAVETMRAAGGGLMQIYYHPCEWATNEFWDGVNFARGQNPPARWQNDGYRPRVVYDYEPPRQPSAAELAARYEALDRWLAGVATSGARSVTCRELPELYPDTAIDAEHSLDDLLDATADWDGSVDYVRLPAGWLTAAETLLLAARLAVARAGGEARPRARAAVADGPSEAEPTLQAGAFEISSKMLVQAAEVLGAQHADGAWRPLPATVRVGGRTAHVPDHASGMPVPCASLLAALLAWLRDGGDRVRLLPTELAARRHVASAELKFDWACFPRDYEAPAIMAAAQRQAWTIKPAERGP